MSTIGQPERARFRDELGEGNGKAIEHYRSRPVRVRVTLAAP